MIIEELNQGEKMEKMSYAESGVDIFKEEKAIKGLLSKISYQRKGLGKPLGGEYAGMVEFGEHALVLCTDGVGSKIMIANKLKKMGHSRNRLHSYECKRCDMCWSRTNGLR